MRNPLTKRDRNRPVAHPLAAPAPVAPQPTTTTTTRPASPAFTTPRPDLDAPIASYAVYAPHGHFSVDDEARMRRLMMERLVYRADLYCADDDPTTGAPCAERLALHFATDLHDFWMGAGDDGLWPSGARLFDDRTPRAPYAQVVDAARDAISAWNLGATLFDPTASLDDDPTETDVDEIDLIESGLLSFLA